jgi:protein-S-isoprenylcysteine O-methyltransferase Ste14
MVRSLYVAARGATLREEARVRTRRIAELGGTGLLAGLFVAFAWAHYVAFTATHRPSLVFAVATETLLAGFILVRRPATEVSFSPWAWAAALGGTFAPLLLRPVDGVADQLLGTVVQLVGSVVSIGAIVSLNRCIGLLPAHRGIARGGMYRFVRHPLYTAYALTCAGYLMNHASVRNAALVVACLGFQVARLVNEERLLSSDPEYLAYKAETRWRLLPFVF